MIVYSQDGETHIAAVDAGRMLSIVGNAELTPVAAQVRSRLGAIIERAAGLDDPPGMHLVFGARTAAELYDLADLEKMTAQWPWLTVTPAASAEVDYRGETGTVADIIGRRVPLADRDAYVCGSSAMVAATVKRLQSLGMAQDHIYVEDFGWSES